MLSVEYTIIFAATVSAFILAGQTLAPTVEAYQASLHQELLENRALIQELENACAVPAS